MMLSNPALLLSPAGVTALAVVLNINPSFHFPSFKKAVNNRASSLYVAYAINGLLASGISYIDADWRTINETPAADPTPNRNIPVEPVNPAAGAHAGTVQIFINEMNAFQAFRQEANVLKQSILLSLDPSIVQGLQHPTTGLTAHTVQSIMAHLNNLFGTLREEDLFAQLALLNVTCNDINLFPSHAVSFQTIFTYLASVNQPYPTMMMINLLETSLQSNYALTQALKKYKREIPFADRIFQNLVNYITLHADSYNTTTPTTGSTGYAGSTTNVEKLQQQIRTLSDQVRSLNQRGSSTTQPTVAQNLVPRSQTGQLTPLPIKPPPPPGRHPNPNLDRTKYCYYHGFGHLGSTCTIMLGDPMYTAPYINSKSPMEVVGGHN